MKEETKIAMATPDQECTDRQLTIKQRMNNLTTSRGATLQQDQSVRIFKRNKMKPVQAKDVARVLSYIMGATKPQLENLLINKKIPLLYKNLIKAIIQQNKTGKTKTFQFFMDRIIGKSVNKTIKTSEISVKIKPTISFNQSQVIDVIVEDELKKVN